MVNARLKWHGKDKHQSIMKNNLNQLGHHVPLSLLQSHPKTRQTDRLRKSKLRLYVIHKNQILILTNSLLKRKNRHVSLSGLLSLSPFTYRF